MWEAGRRLPAPDEVIAFLASQPGEQPEEMTSVVFWDDGLPGGGFAYTTIDEQTSGTGTVFARPGFRHYSFIQTDTNYRCVAAPSN